MLTGAFHISEPFHCDGANRLGVLFRCLKCSRYNWILVFDSRLRIVETFCHWCVSDYSITIEGGSPVVIP